MSKFFGFVFIFFTAFSSSYATGPTNIEIRVNMTPLYKGYLEKDKKAQKERTGNLEKKGYQVKEVSHGSITYVPTEQANSLVKAQGKRLPRHTTYELGEGHFFPFMVRFFDREGYNQEKKPLQAVTEGTFAIRKGTELVYENHIGLNHPLYSSGVLTLDIDEENRVLKFTFKPCLHKSLK